MTPAPAAAGKSIKTAAVRQNENIPLYKGFKEMRDLIEFDSFKQRAAQAAANIKLAGESL